MKKSILEVLRDYDMDIKQEGSVLRSFCPFHDDTGKPNFTVYPSTNSFFCFACNSGGNAIKFISMIESIPYSEAEARFNGQNIEVDELKERLEIQTEEIQTFNAEVNIEVSQHCRKYLHTYPEKAKEVMKYLQGLDQMLQQDIAHTKMIEILDNTKKTFRI